MTAVTQKTSRGASIALVAAKAAPVLAATAATALASRIVVSLPGTPVPLTLQVMTVLLAGFILGSRRGAVSQMAFLAAIVSGLPLDARMHGIAALFGPTGGYLIGFVPAAFIAGHLSQLARGRFTGLLAAAILALVPIYGLGCLWLAFSLGGNINHILAAGLTPFVWVDLMKAILAASLCTVGNRLRRR